MPLTFPKTIRLCRSSEFLRVKTQGETHRGRFFMLGVLRGCDSIRVGVITTKKVGIAVERNKVRRRIRELIRHTLPNWVPGIWLVVVVRQSAAEARFEDLRREWLRVIERAGILQKPC